MTAHDSFSQSPAFSATKMQPKMDGFVTRIIRTPLALYIFFVILTAAVMFRSSPAIWTMPPRDASVFFYIGEGILQGEIPYRDIWDHKAPLVYYISALGLILGQGSQWGVFALQTLLIAVAGFGSFRLMQRQLSLPDALVGTLVFYLMLARIDKGYVPELYAITAQVGIFYILHLLVTHNNRTHFAAVALGVCTAALFLLKPNLVGAGAAAALCILLYARSANLRVPVIALLSILGFIIPIALVALYFALHNALNDLTEAAFVFNSAYSTVNSFGDRISFLRTHVLNVQLPFVLLAGFGAGLAIFERVRGTKLAVGVVLALLLLPIEIILSSLSGFNFAQYTFTWFLPLSWLIAFVIHYLYLVFKTYPRRRVIVAMASLATVVALSWYGYRIASNYRQVFTSSSVNSREIAMRTPTSDYLRTYTTASDSVLVWGHEVPILWDIDRVSSTRFIYQGVLFSIDSQLTSRLATEVLDSIYANSPTFIVDTVRADDNFFGGQPPLDREAYARWSESNGTNTEYEAVVEFISDNYDMIELLPEQNWYIYRLNRP